MLELRVFSKGCQRLRFYVSWIHGSGLAAAVKALCSGVLLVVFLYGSEDLMLSLNGYRTAILRAADTTADIKGVEKHWGTTALSPIISENSNSKDDNGVHYCATVTTQDVTTMIRNEHEDARFLINNEATPDQELELLRIEFVEISWLLQQKSTMVNTRNGSLTPAVTMESLQEQLQQLQQTIATMMTHQTVVNNEIEAPKTSAGTSNGRGSQTNNNHYGRMTKIEFPKFHRDDVKGWYIKKYEDGTPWEMYEGEVIKRFGATYEDLIVDLKNLKQDGSVQQYQESFEALLNKVELNEAYAVSLFIGGLKKEISMPIRMFKITSLIDVYAMAKMQEATNAVLKPRYTSPLLSSPKFVTNTISANKSVNTPIKSTAVNEGNQFIFRNGGNRPYRLTPKELEDKRAKNQCFYCEQKYFPDHKCSGQLNSLEVVSENQEELLIKGITRHLRIVWRSRVKGLFGKNTLHILVDCGSTNNFLDLKTVKNLGCQFENTTPLQVSVANSQHMMTYYKCKNFQWNSGGKTFTSDVMLLPLGGCEMVLGIQWLATLEDIQCNFKNLTMKFEYKGRRMVLRGTKNTIIHWMQGKNATKSGQIKQAELASMVLCVYPV
ncbi:reverse transcriptase, partial [Tanacetum coccineum]